MITTALLKDDIKNCEAKLIQAAAYLADLPEDNVVKADLTGMMTARKRELEISIDEETITLEEMNEIIKTCTKVRDSMAKEIESLECENHVHPDGKEQLKSQIVMAEKMKKILDQRIRFFKQVAKRI